RGSKNKNIIQNLPFSDDPHFPEWTQLSILNTLLRYFSKQRFTKYIRFRVLSSPLDKLLDDYTPPLYYS
ncbi:MAG: hypothetical protein ACJA01_004350, partial [Saprospiraceae bacterium]